MRRLNEPLVLSPQFFGNSLLFEIEARNCFIVKFVAVAKIVSKPSNFPNFWWVLVDALGRVAVSIKYKNSRPGTQKEKA